MRLWFFDDCISLMENKTHKANLMVYFSNLLLLRYNQNYKKLNLQKPLEKPSLWDFVRQLPLSLSIPDIKIKLRLNSQLIKSRQANRSGILFFLKYLYKRNSIST